MGYFYSFSDFFDPSKIGAHKTGSQPVKQEVNKVLKTGFLFYSLTTCVMDRCKQILTYFLLSADASLDIASLTKTTNLHLWTVTAYWRLIILSWANSRLGVPDLFNCQSWLSLPDILLFVCRGKKSFQVLIGLGDFFMKKPKRGSFVKWCISIVILMIFTVCLLVIVKGFIGQRINLWQLSGVCE